MTWIVRALLLAAIGAAAGAASLLVAFARHPDLTLEMDRDLPRFAFGFYPPEISGQQTFAWTSERAQLNIVDLNRRTTWGCAVALRSGRPPDLPAPSVQLAIDGVTDQTVTPAHDYQTVNVTAPARPDKRGLNLAIITTPTFVPSAADPRQLGVQVDRIQCIPQDTAFALPSRRAMVAATMITALFGLALGFAGVSLWPAIAGVIAIAMFQATALSSGSGPYGPYADRLVALSEWVALGMVGSIRALDYFRRDRLRPEARFTIVFSAVALFLYIAGLLHPQKLVIDAVFHAHRLDWVMGGRYFFTQPMPNGVEFPYAIALYVAAAPWTAFARDHVTLLRIFVCTAQLGAGALLYWMVVRSWNDRLAGAVSVVLFAVVPMPFVVLGNANLTNAFGQAIALVVVAIATTAATSARRVFVATGLTLVTAAALLSHVSTFGLLCTTLTLLAISYWSLGGKPLRPAALIIAIALVAAVVISVVSYYGHFLDVYRNLNRTAPDAGAAARVSSFGVRLGQALVLGAKDVGGPILTLAAIGAWRTIMVRGRDPLTCAMVAYAATYVVFLLFATLVPVGASFERYVIEFISRADYALYPAAVLLAGRGAAWTWRQAPVGRVVSAGLVVAALVVGTQAWTKWFM